MKMSEYRVLHDKMEDAYDILDEKYDRNRLIKHFKNVINGRRCVYEDSKGVYRIPTLEEIEEAYDNLLEYKQRIEVLNAKFVAL